MMLNTSSGAYFLGDIHLPISFSEVSIKTVLPIFNCFFILEMLKSFYTLDASLLSDICVNLFSPLTMSLMSLNLDEIQFTRFCFYGSCFLCFKKFIPIPRVWLFLFSFRILTHLEVTFLHGEGREPISSFCVTGHCPSNTQCIVWPFASVLAPAFSWLWYLGHVHKALVVMVASREVSWLVEGRDVKRNLFFSIHPSEPFEFHLN